MTRDRVQLMAGYGASGVRGEQPSFDAYMASEAGQGELQAFKDRVRVRAQQELPTQGERSGCCADACARNRMQSACTCICTQLCSLFAATVVASMNYP